MFDFLNKKRKAKGGNPNGGNEDTEEVVAPDADAALDEVEAALQKAERIKLDEQAQRERDYAASKKSCGCW